MCSSLQLVSVLVGLPRSAGDLGSCPGDADCCCGGHSDGWLSACSRHGIVMAILLLSVAALAVGSWRNKRLHRKGKGVMFTGEQVR